MGLSEQPESATAAALVAAIRPHHLICPQNVSLSWSWRSVCRSKAFSVHNRRTKRLLAAASEFLHRGARTSPIKQWRTGRLRQPPACACRPARRIVSDVEREVRDWRPPAVQALLLDPHTRVWGALGASPGFSPGRVRVQRLPLDAGLCRGLNKAWPADPECICRWRRWGELKTVGLVACKLRLYCLHYGPFQDRG